MRRCLLSACSVLAAGCLVDKSETGQPVESGNETGLVDSDHDGYLAIDDCDDGDAQVHPGADERCNEADDDCDGAVDEDPVDGSVWYVDGDKDGYGSEPTDIASCDQPGSAAAVDGDCDDEDAEANPGAVEVCDETDNDCDGQVDEEAADAVECVPDEDGDGYGQDAPVQLCCSLEAGWVAPGEADCDDDNRAVNMGSEEICNLADDDCDGQTDEDDDGDDAVDSLCDLWSEHVLSDADLVLFGDDNTGQRSSFLLMDANTDGYADLWMASQKAEVDGATWSGQVWLLLGPLTESGYATDLAAATLEGAPNDQAGHRLDNPGDLDGDGYPELWVAVRTDASSVGGGSVHLVLGPVSGTSSIHDSDLSWSPDVSGWSLYYADLGVGDYDGDDVNDLFIGAGVANGTGGRSSGQAWVVRQDGTWGEHNLSAAPLTLEASREQEQLGVASVIIGSTTGDGVDDLVVTGVCTNSRGGAGAAWVVEETPADGTYVIDDLADATLVGENAGDNAGAEAVDLGDMNADGYGDYAVSASDQTTSTPRTGAVYVIYGPTSARTNLSQADVKLLGVEEKEKVRNIAGEADVDADGWLDLMASGYEPGSGDLMGTTYLVRGPLDDGTSTLSGADAVFNGELHYHYSGSGLSMSGDTNKDGYPELIIGAYGYEDETFDGGALYLFHGQPF